MKRVGNNLTLFHLADSYLHDLEILTILIQHNYDLFGNFRPR